MLHIEHVAHQVIVLRRRGHGIEQCTLLRGALQVQVVEGVLVALDLEHLEGVADAGLPCCGFAISPIRREDDLLNARFEDIMKMLPEVD